MIEFRSGDEADSETIAEMITIASDGVVDFLFHDLLPGMTPVQLLAHNLTKDSLPHTFKNTIVAAEGNQLVGAALSYTSAYHRVTPELRDFLPVERLQHLEEFYSSRVEDSWLLDTLYVAEGFRRQGIGGTLLSLVQERAAREGYDALSLIVFSDNEPAVQLYEKAGFHVVSRVELKRNQFIQHDGGCLLMKRESSI